MMRPPCSAGRRRGFGLIELAVTGLLLVVMAALTAQVVATVAAHRRGTARREAAARLAADLVEEARVQPWDRLTTEAVRPWAAARLVHEPALAGADCRVRVEVEPAAPIAGHAARRIRVEVAFPDATPGIGPPVRLVGWAFDPTRPAEARP